MKSSRVADAFDVFDQMSSRNVVAWTSMMSGCVQNGRHEIGFSLFVEMLETGVPPNDFTLNVAIQACADMAMLCLGEQVHSLVVRSGLAGDCRTSNFLINFYSKCGSLDEALLVFHKISEPDSVSFTSVISGLCKNGSIEWAVEVFVRMRSLGFEVNEHMFASLLSVSMFDLGEQIHACMIKNNLAQTPYALSALIEFYARYGLIESMILVFEKSKSRNVVLWSSIISCCVHNDVADLALKFFSEMVSSASKPNEFTFATAISACGLGFESAHLGRQIHCSVIKLDMVSKNRVSNALLSMYARIGVIEELEKVFDGIESPDIVSWCSMISAYFQNGFNEKSINFFAEMHRSNNASSPNEYGLSSVISSCAELALLDQGRQFHAHALKTGFESYVCVGNAIVNMYGKCLSITDARRAFDAMQTRNAVSWNSLIHACAHHGRARDAMRAFEEMVARDRVKPNHATFVGVLGACSHGGCIDEAIEFLETMEDRYGVRPSPTHYACVVDAMGRGGRLGEAVRVIERMPFEPDSLTWKTLLGACRVHGETELGRVAAERVVELMPGEASGYVMLAGLHAVRGEWEEAGRARRAMEERGVRKEAGWSWVEVQCEAHFFVAGDRSHPRRAEVYEVVEGLARAMEDVNDIGCWGGLEWEPAL
ncbi:Pentatricopeptide repeat-containing protein [Acorus gramineus]|uniref:Pentatricopeptide repeat-containing protein n=1 Tax=Acorus gramineus TaxID=55184 RepID=A0AAV9AQ88_ACOGR|nr:Pentatricopeptide repeat-containing protein [Acorus gramineus]